MRLSPNDPVLRLYDNHRYTLRVGGIDAEYFPLPDWLPGPIYDFETPRVSQERWSVLAGASEPPRGLNLEAEQALEWERCKANPWYFIINYCTTEDQHDRENPWKTVPKWFHLWLTVQVLTNWQLVSVAKGRQMMETWLMTAYLLWNTLFWQGQLSFIQALKFENADYTLRTRMQHMWRNLPPFLQGLVARENPFTEGLFRLERNQSECRAIAQGGDQFRQFTAGIIFADEAGFQPEIEASYQAGRPLIATGSASKYVMVSTPAHNFWERVHRDRLTDKRFTASIGQTSVVMRRLGYDSVRMRLNNNGFVALEFHWSAHPFHDEDWAAKTRVSMTDAAWRIEHCCEFDVATGDLVWPMWDARIIGYDSSRSLPVLVTLYESMDHGMRSPTVCLWGAVDANDDLYITDEYYRSDLIIRDNVSNILARRKMVLDRFGVSGVRLTLMDPATSRRMDNAYSTVADEYAANGLYLTPADNNQQKKINSVANRLLASLARHSEQTGEVHPYFVERGITRLEDLRYADDHPLHPGERFADQPAIYIDATRCPNTMREMGAWRMKAAPPEDSDRPVSEKPVEKDDHTCDAVGYLAASEPTYQGPDLAMTAMPGPRQRIMEAARDYADAEGRCNGWDSWQVSLRTEELFKELVQAAARRDSTFSWVDPPVRPR